MRGASRVTTRRESQPSSYVGPGVPFLRRCSPRGALRYLWVPSRGLRLHGKQRPFHDDGSAVLAAGHDGHRQGPVTGLSGRRRGDRRSGGPHLSALEADASRLPADRGCAGESLRRRVQGLVRLALRPEAHGHPAAGRRLQLGATAVTTVPALLHPGTHPEDHRGRCRRAGTGGPGRPVEVERLRRRRLDPRYVEEPVEGTRPSSTNSPRPARIPRSSVGNGSCSPTA